ncbi:MAG: hypothetical protein M3464_01920 [Chloroflexota bacterium]|nr:hypothetical protein [Chloroflexota bacterium]
MNDGGNGGQVLQPADLEPLLRAAQHRVEFPPTPDVWPAIERELVAINQAAAGNHLRPFRPEWRRYHRVLVTASLMLLIVIMALLAVPDFRTAVADRLGLSGIVIWFIDEAPPELPAPSPQEATRYLGRHLPMSEARSAVDFSIQVPTTAAMGEPDWVYLTFGRAEELIVTLAYRNSDALPESEFTGVGALLTQFRASTNRDLIEKGLYSKGISPDTRLTSVTVSGAPGYWIEGAAHLLLYEVPSGETFGDELRLAGNVLLWEGGDMTYRLESELTMEAAIAIAESMLPVVTDGAGTD